MLTHRYESKGFVQSSVDNVFAYIDDHTRLSLHMGEPSWKMGGGRMETELDEGRGQKVGSRIRLAGRVFGVELSVEEIVTERSRPYRKLWETTGAPKLLVIGHYRMGFELSPQGNGSMLCVFIEYALPEGHLPVGWDVRLSGTMQDGEHSRWLTTQKNTSRRSRREGASHVGHRWERSMESEYWRIYFGQQVVERSNKIREQHMIQSTGVNIHIDVYPHPNPNAPIVIFNHGTAGYCRLFVPLALSFYDRGYTVVLPDQKGQGFSSGKRGDYTISECVQNIVDVAHWSKNRFNSALFIAGGSVGGALSYYAVSAGAPAHAVSCLDLLDFGNGVDGLKISRLAFLARYALVVAVIKAGAVALKPIHWLRIPAKWVGAFEKLMDERDAAFQKQWDADPVPSRLLSLRSLASNMTSSPAIPFEQNKTPVLVINQSLDKMVDPTTTRKNFERLTGPKQYLEVPFGHWSGQPQFWNTIVKASDEWFQKHLP